MINCIAYPGTRWFIGREELKRLKQSIMPSMEETRETLHMGKIYDFNAMDSDYKFYNGSRIDLLDLKLNPSDPLYERYGSLLYTGGWIEEAGEVHFNAFDTLKSRINRWMNDKYNLFGKIFITCNPKKNWLYNDFWRPWKNNTLSSDSVFIPALYTDNTYTSKHYGETLSTIKDNVKRERLMHGNWEYEDDKSALLDYDSILDIFTNDYTFTPDEPLYLTCDVARFGKDKAVIMLWQGLFIRKIWEYDYSSTKFLREKLERISTQFHIPRSHIVIDAEGVGGGVVDELPGCKSFIGASSPILSVQDKYKKQRTEYEYNFGNLRAQCIFYASEQIKNHKVGCYKEIPISVKENIISELEQWKKKDVDKDDGKVYIIPKEIIKESLGGRSPDYSDNIMMRSIFDLKNEVLLFGFA
jgi:hypothetical protein